MAAKSLDSDLISPHFYLSAPSGYNEPKIQSLMDLERARPNDPTVKARLKIEKYLSLAVISSHRTSFIRRISALADGSFLGSYHPFTALQTSSGPSEPSRIDPFDDTQVTSVVIYNQFKQKYNAEHMLGLELAANFWHFIDVLWIFLFLFLSFFRYII